MPNSTVTLALRTEDSTKALAQHFAHYAKAGTVYLLAGPIGAGKTFFARAFIRACTGLDQDVPSPTFTLVQTYDSSKGEIWHCDLYRLTAIDDVLELGLDDALETAICLIEWPDRLGSVEPKNAINLVFCAESDGTHSVAISGPVPVDLLKAIEDE